jgi:Arc/MetJ family transcription regulator
VTTTLTIDDELFAAAALAMNSGDPNEVVARALRVALAAEDSMELYTPERVAEFERAEKELEEFLKRLGLR